MRAITTLVIFISFLTNYVLAETIEPAPKDKAVTYLVPPVLLNLQ